MPSTPSRHAYGTLPSQWGELHLPEGDGPFRVCVLVHGGFWKAEYAAELMDDLAADLMARGWAAWNIEYRRLSPGPDDARGGEWPALFEDVAAAVDLLVDLAAAHPLDLDRVAVAGHSAGGHLAGWIAGRPGLPAGAPGAGPRVRVVAAVLQAGVLDLAAKAAQDDEGAERVAALIGVTDVEVAEADVASSPCGQCEVARERLATTSPIHMVPLGVPTLAVHGEADDVVPIAHSQRFVAAARAAGDEADLAAFEGEDHMGHAVALNPMWRRAATWLGEQVPT